MRVRAVVPIRENVRSPAHQEHFECSMVPAERKLAAAGIGEFAHAAEHGALRGGVDAGYGFTPLISHSAFYDQSPGSVFSSQ